MQQLVVDNKGVNMSIGRYWRSIWKERRKL